MCTDLKLKEWRPKQVLRYVFSVACSHGHVCTPLRILHGLCETAHVCWPHANMKANVQWGISNAKLNGQSLFTKWGYWSLCGVWSRIRRTTSKWPVGVQWMNAEGIADAWRSVSSRSHAGHNGRFLRAGWAAGWAGRFTRVRSNKLIDGPVGFMLDGSLGLWAEAGRARSGRV